MLAVLEQTDFKVLTEGNTQCKGSGAGGTAGHTVTVLLIQFPGRPADVSKCPRH